MPTDLGDRETVSGLGNRKNATFRTSEGIHLGAMAGSVGIVLDRYAGGRLEPRGVRFAPEMPARFRRIRFRLHWRGRWLLVDLTSDALSVTADPDHAAPVPVHACGAWHDAAPGEPLVIELRPP